MLSSDIVNKCNLIYMILILEYRYFDYDEANPEKLKNLSNDGVLIIKQFGNDMFYLDNLAYMESCFDSRNRWVNTHDMKMSNSDGVIEHNSPLSICIK